MTSAQELAGGVGGRDKVDSYEIEPMIEYMQISHSTLQFYSLSVGIWTESKLS